jgi:hypothetical protein
MSRKARAVIEQRRLVVMIFSCHKCRARPIKNNNEQFRLNFSLFFLLPQFFIVVVVAGVVIAGF